MKEKCAWKRLIGKAGAMVLAAVLTVETVPISTVAENVIPEGGKSEPYRQNAAVTDGLSVLVDNPQTTPEGETVWDKVTFGNYMQNPVYQVEPIKWRILSIEEEHALLLADKALDCMPYHDKEEAVTWETCSLRKWLNDTSVNDTFINTAFTTEEQEALVATRLTNEGNGKNDGGNDTTDRVWILSMSDLLNTAYGFEAKWNATCKKRKTMATDYTIGRGAFVGKGYPYDVGVVEYWLRTPGDYWATDAMRMSAEANEAISASTVNIDSVSVRPVICVDLNSAGVKDAGKVISDGTVITPETEGYQADGFTVPRQQGSDTVWDCVYFGNYKQSGNMEKKPVEWRVLSVSGNDAFLLADKALDCQKFHAQRAGITWETCDLRKWLNDTDDPDAFISQAFTEEEQRAILKSKETGDKVYLLSVEEATDPRLGFPAEKGYDHESNKWAANYTQYAKNRGASGANNAERLICLWWLRSTKPDSYEPDKNKAWYVAGKGIYGTQYTEQNYIAVRPVLHVDLTSAAVSYSGTVCSNGETRTAEEVINMKAARMADALIASIGEVDKDSAQKIKAARAAYDQLSAEAKKLVTGYAVLVKAEEDYAMIEANEKQAKEAAEAVDELIRAIGEVDKDSKDAIEAAQKAYGGLNDAAKAKVTLYETLQQAVGEYAALMEKEQKELEKAEAVDALIKAIGEVTKDSKEQIEAAQKAYDKLSNTEKAKVTLYETLQNATKQYAAIDTQENPQENPPENPSQNDPGTGGMTETVSGAQTKEEQNPPKVAVKAPDQVKIKSAKSRKKNTAVVSWRKAKEAAGYEVQYSFDKKFKKSVTKKTGKMSLTLKKLKKGKNCYIRVRAYRKDTNGQKVYGEWSKAKKVKIRK
ncbi:MAG: hypothetical protein E7294_09815 [Lachnospiraceae bacterium]|nr:hypothetical protein [Lachnospiraceae bacterium]